jgi:DNA-binding transcriptional LysR family regulator
MHRFTLRQLEIFAAIARTKSLTRAAAEVHLTQPAVSMQLKQLEDAVGVPLAEPAGRGIQLTDAGREFAENVEDMLDRVAHLEDLVARWKGVRSGRVRLGIVSTAKYFVPKLLAQFLRSHPGVDFRMTIHNRAQIVDELRANTVDFAIMGRPPEGIDCVATPFAPNLLGVVAAPEHPLSRRRGLAASELAGEAFIVRETGSGTRAAMERFFGAHHLKWRTAMEMASNESIKQAVMAGLGLGFLSLLTVRSELAAGRLVALDVEGLPVQSRWFAVRRTSRRLVPAAEEFGEFLVREGQPLLNADGNLLEALAPQRRRPAGKRSRKQRAATAPRRRR